MKKRALILVAVVGAALFFLNDKTSKKEAVPLSYDAKAAIVMNESGKVLYEKNSKQALPIASMSKLMTQYIILEALANNDLSWDDKYEPSAVAMNQDRHAVKLGMDTNSTYTVRELFTAMTVISANDATIALAEMVSGSEEAFVAEMNKRAKQLGLKHTHFVNATGLDADETNQATARDVAAIARTVLNEHPEILEFTRMTDFTTDEGVKRWSTNLMLPGMPEAMPGLDGLKTGYTEIAESCFASTGIFNGERIITVVIGVEADGKDTTTPRFDLTRELIDSYVLNK
ncbi:D-alanyl-D-alanine carboxypeptidase family protein [Sporosarcina saromensis]|uniref:D-alanyl-D-alanine carboxypeptidase family protein n=1 Tax=Sporosarcina saromensis TaxID=359365 RepID=A0ABU4GCE7_9BACL|nr:D-alanyl-D-alanine carboxypeptidase family protein [Sporosarcina saromensis]MDW0113257.1 D-alanyl-D-alanine carboxypeptidase family protein [Sporosarcina saromensis]